LSDSHPVLPGAEAYRSAGDQAAPGHRHSVGIALIHGFTGSPISLRPLAEELVQRGFRVDLPRLPGHGTHVKDMQRTRYADWRSEVLAAVDRLALASERVVLLGLSMGGTLALDVASSSERSIAAVVSVNGQILERGGFAVKLAPMIERLTPLVPAALAGLRKDDIAKPGVSERAYDWVPPAAGSSFLRELPRVREQLTRLACPALIAYSPNDHSVPPENSHAMLELLRARSPEVLLLERSYHVATLDYDLELIAERVTAFLDRLPR